MDLINISKRVKKVLRSVAFKLEIVKICVCVFFFVSINGFN